ncbi:TRAP transporter substrate-binding protein [Rubrimonas cliftonensis]|uniref:TRAP-type C4-dicarboxylate transport system, substrate-binding protein n=1 Tax=Rubrimonas cliftonensis TaxID=89524 RepID=A0A1H4FKS3_9RHOB|nr:TRAP transporter substrate-binding protein [Rubrimonas cliftonensis]SEA97875.1 TRAP-type C4-dicarboxylate transport system, substrate-binding protein [Rubrimonas cliftonensis]
MTAKTLAAALALSLTLPLPGLAADVELVLSSWLPPRHPIVVNAIRPWAEEVEAVTEGRVSVRVLGKAAGSPPAHFDMARDGVADITYGLHSFSQDDRFKGSQIGQFSFIGDDAVSASEAFWTVYTEDLGAQAEHAGTRLLGLFVHGPGLIHNNVRRIETPADFAGLKIRVPGGYIAELTAALGADALFMSSPEVYEKLSRGVIDGVAFTYEALTAFNLTDYVKFSLKAPGGVYNTTWFLVANEARWAEISQQDQAAIEAISGLAFARRVGEAWNGADAAAVSEIEAAGIDVHPASDAVVAAIREKGAALEQAWAAGLGEGRDGAAALARLRGMTGVSN